MLSWTRAHASHPANGIAGGGMLWCALAVLVSQPPRTLRRLHPEEDVFLRTPPPTRPPLERGEDAMAPPPCQPF